MRAHFKWSDAKRKGRLLARGPFEPPPLKLSRRDPAAEAVRFGWRCPMHILFDSFDRSPPNLEQDETVADKAIKRYEAKREATLSGNYAYATMARVERAAAAAQRAHGLDLELTKWQHRGQYGTLRAAKPLGELGRVAVKAACGNKMQMPIAPHELDEQARRPASKRSTKWNLSTSLCEYSVTGTHTCASPALYERGAPETPPSL